MPAWRRDTRHEHVPNIRRDFQEVTVLDLASVDSMAFFALQILAWSNLGVAAAFLLVPIAALACVAFDCLRDRRAPPGSETLQGLMAGRES